MFSEHGNTSNATRLLLLHMLSVFPHHITQNQTEQPLQPPPGTDAHASATPADALSASPVPAAVFSFCVYRSLSLFAVSMRAFWVVVCGQCWNQERRDIIMSWALEGFLWKLHLTMEFNSSSVFEQHKGKALHTHIHTHAHTYTHTSW